MSGVIGLTIRSEPAAFNACACDRCRLTGPQFKSPKTAAEFATQIGSDGA